MTPLFLIVEDDIKGRMFLNLNQISSIETKTYVEGDESCYAINYLDLNHMVIANEVFNSIEEQEDRLKKINRYLSKFNN